MAKPIELMPKVNAAQGVREELKRRVDAAPVEHAEAVLAGYDLLQELHDSGTLDVLRGLLGAGDQVVRHTVGLATKPEAVNALRNLLALSKVLGGVNPDRLERAVSEIPSALTTAPEEPPSLFAIFRRMSSTESRRGLAAAVTVLEGVGRGLGPAKHKPD